jgi:hypothetical protein
MIWVYVLIGIALFIGLIEWTARPRGSARGVPDADANVHVPRQRAPGALTRYDRKVG